MAVPLLAKAEEIAPAPPPNQSHYVNGCDDSRKLWQGPCLGVRGSSPPLLKGIGGREQMGPAHMPLGPRAMAAMPVRETSARPSSVMIEMNCSILELRPVISNTK